MRALRLFVLLVLIGVFSASCGICNGGGGGLLGTPVPTTTQEAESAADFWSRVNDTLRSVGRTWDEARRTHPD